MATYTKEDFITDCDWLDEEGIDMVEIPQFVQNLITAGFNMSDKEYLEFMKSIENPQEDN